MWEASVRELLTVGSEDHLEATLWEALEIVGLAERVRASAAGIEAQVVGADDAQGPEACLRFSCGELQLLAFARAILETDRPFMLLDETDSRLDVEGEAKILEAIKNCPLLRDRTIIAVSHRTGTFVRSHRHHAAMS